MHATLRTLKLPSFPNLVFAQAINELGDWLGVVALAILVFDRTGSALATTGLFIAMQFLPALLAPALVARLEAHRPRGTLACLYLLEAGLFAGLGALAGDFLLAAVIALAAVDGTVAATARSLNRAASGAILKRAGVLREGNALLNVAFTAGAAVGPALAGIIVAGAGARAALFVDAASFLAVAVVVAIAPGLPRPELEASGWLPRLRNGLAYVRGRPLLGRLLTAQAIAFVFFAAVIPIEVVFAKQTLGAGDGGYGALLASWGAGMVVGSVVFMLLRGVSLRALLLAGTLAIGVAYLCTAAAPSLAVACAASVVGGAGNGVQWVALISTLQEVTAPAYQARVLSLLESVAAAMPGVGFLLGGVVASVVAPRATFALAGAGVLAVVAAAILILRRAEWPIEPKPPSGERPLLSPAAMPGTPAGEGRP